jgi:hypothetical protein
MTAKQAAQIEKLTARIGELELQLAKAKRTSTTSAVASSFAVFGIFFSQDLSSLCLQTSNSQAR